MSSDNRGVVRHSTSPPVEEYDLPQWNRKGEVVKPAKAKVAVQKVEEVEKETIKVPTVAELEAIREAAYNEGFEQGFANGMSQGEREGKTAGHKEGLTLGQQEGQLKGLEEGRQQALAEEQKKTAEKLAVFDVAANKLNQQRALEQTELEQALLGLSLRLAAQIVQDEMTLTPEHIQPIVHAAVQSLPNPDEKLTVLLNPLDLELVERIADSHWHLEGGTAIKRGGCKIKSGFSYVDYTLEHRFETAVAQLLSQWQAQTDSKNTSVTAPLSSDTLINESSDALDTSEPVPAVDEPVAEVKEASETSASVPTEDAPAEPAVAEQLSNNEVTPSGTPADSAEQKPDDEACDEPDTTD